jgi:hypothetical protein
MGVASVNEAYLKQVEKYRHRLVYRLQLARYLGERLSGWSLDSWANHANDPAVFARAFEGQIDPLGPEYEELRSLMEKAPQVAASEWYRDPSNWYRDEAHVGRFRYALRRLQELSQQNDFTVVLLLIPFMDWTPRGYPHETLHRIVKWEAERLGFEVVDVSARLRAHAANELAFGGRDPVHPNELGHKIIADELHLYLRTLVPTEGQ